MLERLLLTTAIALVTFGGFALFQQWQRRRVDQRLGDNRGHAILYFRSDSCAACGTQARFLAEVAADVPVETIDVVAQPEQAARFGVMTLPTTIVIGADGNTRHINYGLADARKLRRQLAV